MTYELKNIDGYNLVLIDGRLFLIDTGAPSILTNSVVINGISFNEISFNEINNQRALSSLKNTFNTDVELIGVDILRSLGTITVNKINNTVTFGNSSITPIHSLKINSDLTGEVVFNGIITKAFFDTGAPKFVASERLLAGAKYLRDTIEPTMNGPVNTKEYESEIEIDGVKKIVSSLLHTNNMPGYMYELFVSINILSDKYYIIDFNKMKILFE